MKPGKKKLLKQFVKAVFSNNPRLESGVNESHVFDHNRFNGCRESFHTTG